MSDFRTMASAFFTMLLMMVFGILLAFCVLTAKDFIFPFLQSMGIDGGAGTAWSSEREINIIVALLYFICSLPPVLGIIQFGLAVTKKQRRDEFAQSGATYDDGWDGQSGGY